MNDLSNLKPGDAVLIRAYKFGVETLEMNTVVRVTPTGRIVTDNSTYDPNGWQRGYGICQLIPYSEQVWADYQERDRLWEMRGRLDSITWLRPDISDDQIERVYAIRVAFV